jgi:hypothetical protein
MKSMKVDNMMSGIRNEVEMGEANECSIIKEF